MNFLGIYREPLFSPGRHASNDATILRLVGQALERLGGVHTELASLDEARARWKTADLIFSMCQGPDALEELQNWKRGGAFILNDPEASRRTYRDSLCSTLREKELGFPHSFFIRTDASAELDACRALFEEGSAWLKRADVHATQQGDVSFLKTFEDLACGLKKFADRGLATAVVQSHCAGDEVKFYGVRGGRLFWPYYPKDSQGYPFDEHVLERLADRAAETLDLGIYGGDAIISPEGEITLIDLNDWPSFAPCRGAAASAIARYLKEVYAQQGSRQTVRAR